MSRENQNEHENDKQNKETSVGKKSVRNESFKKKRQMGGHSGAF